MCEKHHLWNETYYSMHKQVWEALSPSTRKSAGNRVAIMTQPCIKQEQKRSNETPLNGAQISSVLYSRGT